MSEGKRCPELFRLPNFLEVDKPLPADFCEHARGCHHCLFWASYALAAQKASHTTDRVINENCPSNGELGALLLTTIRGVKAGRTDKIKQDIFYIDSESFSAFYELQEHINGNNPEHCPWCRTYFNEIFNKMMQFQKQYEADILAGKSVKPVIVDISLQIPVERIMRDIDPSKKPN